MASSKIKGITIEIGGDTTKLGKAIGDVDKQSRSLQGELKQIQKLLDLDPGNTELLAQKQQVLTAAVKETTEKLKILKQAEAQVVDQFNRGDIGEDQLRAFQREVAKTEQELKSFESQLDGTDDSIEKVGDAAEQSGDGFTIMKGALADLVSNAIQGAISAIGDFIGSLLDLSEATEEYRSMQAKLAGSADTFGYSVDFANAKYKEFYKYLGDDQMATNAITNLMGIGAETDTITKLADGATAVWATYGDSIPVESLTEAINETITVGKVTGTMADSINWCKTSNEQLKGALGGNKEALKAFNQALKDGEPVEDAFNAGLAEITSTQERADVVAKFLNSTYGDSKKKYDELNGSVNDANEAELKLKDTQAQLGETMAPVNTALTNLKNQALQAIAPLVEKLADGFTRLYNYLQKHPAVAKAVTTVVIALAAAFGVLATALGIQTLILGVTKAFSLLGGALSINPITIFIAAIAALVAAFIYLWNNCESFRNFWKKLWTNVKTFFVSAWNSVRSFCTKTIPQIINNIVNWFKQLPGKIWTWLLNTVTRVVNWGSRMKSKAKETASGFIQSVISFFKQLPGKVWTWLVNTVQKVIAWKSNLVSKGKEAGKQLLDAVVNKVKEIPGKVKSLGKNIAEGLINGITNMKDWVISKVKGFCKSALDGIKDFFGIKSPSKVMEKEVGEQIANGMIKGVDNKKDNAKKSAKELAELYVKAGKTKVSELKKTNELTLADEVAFWAAVRKQCVKGTQAYHDANQQLKVARSELNEKLTTLNSQYEADVKRIQENLVEDIQAVTDAYEQAITDRQKQIASSMGLFDAFAGDDAISKYELTSNLQSQVSALREWDEVLDSLASREGMDTNLLADLEDMGVSSLNTLKQVNAMSDAELSAYIALYQEKNRIALERSEAEHQALKAESEKQIQDLIDTAEKKLKDLNDTYTSELKQIGVKSSKQATSVGVNIVRGIISGIDSQISALRAKMAELSAITVQTAAAELKIKSPSRVFADVIGKQIPAGIAQGILSNSGVANDAARAVANGMVNSATLNRKLTTTFGGVTSGGVVDSGLLNKLDRIYERLNRLQIVLDTGTLVGETIDKIDSGLASRQLLSARGV